MLGCAPEFGYDTSLASLPKMHRRISLGNVGPDCFEIACSDIELFYAMSVLKFARVDELTYQDVVSGARKRDVRRRV